MTNYSIESPIIAGCFPPTGIRNSFVTYSAADFAANYRAERESGLPPSPPVARGLFSLPMREACRSVARCGSRRGKADPHG